MATSGSPPGCCFWQRWATRLSRRRSRRWRTGARVAVFVGAAAASTLVSLLGVVIGPLLTQYVPAEIIHKVAAVAFIAVVVLMLFGKM